jgi:hypothetical protein
VPIGQRQWSMWISAIPALACVVLAFVYAPPSAQKHAATALREDRDVCEPSGDNHRLVASFEKVNEAESAPYRAGDDWVFDRTFTLVGKCSYQTLIGGVSTQSYLLPPFKVSHRVTICQGGSAVEPYKGPCPPK